MRNIFTRNYTACIHLFLYPTAQLLVVSVQCYYRQRPADLHHLLRRQLLSYVDALVVLVQHLYHHRLKDVDVTGEILINPRFLASVVFHLFCALVPGVRVLVV